MLHAHLLMPAVHATHRVRVHREGEVLVHASVFPPHPVRIRVGTVEGLGNASGREGRRYPRLVLRKRKFVPRSSSRSSSTPKELFWPRLMHASAGGGKGRLNFLYSRQVLRR